MRRTLTLVAISLLAAVLAGCGSTKRVDGSALAPSLPMPQAPHGKLTAAEFRPLLVAMTGLDAAQRSHDPAVAVRRLESICARLSGPPTRLFTAIAADCHGTAALYKSIVGLKGAFQSCKDNSPPGDPSCYVETLSGLRRVVAAALVTSRASDRELKRRGLRGRCAAVIGSSRATLGALGALRTSAGDAASALSNGDAPDYIADLHRVGRAISSVDRSGYRGSQRRAILSCPHE